MLEINESDFKPIRDFVFIEADAERGRKKKLEDGTEIFIDTDFNPHSTENATQDGIVRYIPTKLESGKRMELSPGDHVYTHHFLCDEENKIMVNGKLLYMLRYESIYCKVVPTGIQMLENWNLVEPIEEDESNYKTASGIYIKSSPDVVKQNGTMRCPSPKIEECGVNEGDRVIFTKVADYPIKIEGQTLYRMEDRDILAVVQN